jgi:hypothetical protein
VAGITGMLDLSGWPSGMRVIVRKERPHPGAQLRFTDLGGHRFTCFATSTKGGQLADLELRHRRRARCEDRIRAAKDTGLRNLPPQGFAQNQIWCQIVAMACELLAWMAMLAPAGPARREEPTRLRLRLFPAAGRLVRGGRRLRLRIAATWPWATHITTATTRLNALAPSRPATSVPATRKDNHQGPRNPAHPARQPGHQATARPQNKAISRSTRPPSQDHERCRLAQMGTRATRGTGARLPTLTAMSDA